MPCLQYTNGVVSESVGIHFYFFLLLEWPWPRIRHNVFLILFHIRRRKRIPSWAASKFFLTSPLWQLEKENETQKQEVTFNPGPKRSEFSIRSARGFHQEIESTASNFEDIILCSMINFPRMEANKPRKINKTHQLSFGFLLHINWENSDIFSYSRASTAYVLICHLNFCLKEEKKKKKNTSVYERGTAAEEKVLKMSEVLLKLKYSGQKRDVNAETIKLFN